MSKEEQKIKDLIQNDLVIRRVPKKYLAWFKEYANEEFAGDYGMLLRELINFYRGMFNDTMLSGLDMLHTKTDKVLGILEATQEKKPLKRTEWRQNRK